MANRPRSEITNPVAKRFVQSWQRAEKTVEAPSQMHPLRERFMTSDHERQVARTERRNRDPVCFVQ
jgi:hypothetical protein